MFEPAFNDSDWFRKDDDPALRDWHGAGAQMEQSQVDPQCAARQRRQFGVPPKGNANFAWVQHFIHCIHRSLGEGGHFAPQGMAGFVLANGPAVAGYSTQSGEGDIRRDLIETDLDQPNRLRSTSSFFIPPSAFLPCLWFLAKNKHADAKRGFRDRRQQTLFIDARKLGSFIERVHRELTDADLHKINHASAKFSLN